MSLCTRAPRRATRPPITQSASATPSTTSAARSRTPAGSSPSGCARRAAGAEERPLDENSVDAAMACVTVHHWRDRARGLAELRRVARGPVVIFTFELERLPEWQRHYLREGLVKELPRFPALGAIAAALGGRTRVERIATPGDCSDGFFEAFWRRPERLLDPAVRGAQSMWALLEEGEERRIVERLSASLASGGSAEPHGHLPRVHSFGG